MANPSYSTDNVNFTTLPGDYMIDGVPDYIKEDTDRLYTGSGRMFSYNNFTMRGWKLRFEVNPSQVAAHRTFFNATVGGVSVYFSYTGAGAGDSVLVNRVSNEYEPKELQRTSVGIRSELTYDLQETLS